MKNKENFSRQGLIQACSDLRKNLDRDKIELEQMNITTSMVTDFETKLASVKQVEQDGVIRDKKKLLTQQKNKLRNQLHTEMYRSLLFLQAFMDEDSTLLDSLQMKGLSKKNDTNFTNQAEGFIQLITNNSAELLAFGLDKNLPTKLSDQIEEFRELLSERKALTHLREIQKQERSTLFSQLYKDYLRICMVGKSVWYGANAAKWNDYKITIK